MTKTIFDRMISEIAKFTPRVGFNLVGQDRFETPGEECLYLVAHFATRAAADAGLRARAAQDPDEVLFIYGASPPTPRRARRAKSPIRGRS